jgi:hypothetical protein
MSMIRRLFFICLLAAAPAVAQPSNAGDDLHGRVEGKFYIAPGGVYRIAIPVLPELGATINDTDRVVTFQDDYNVHISIACFPQDATQRWELSTRGLKDYLVYFFGTFVQPDFQQAVPGSRIESAKFAPALAGGALIVYTLLPGGSMFSPKASVLGAAAQPPVAKRGNLVYVHREHIYVISTELAERALEGGNYKKTTAEEDEILRQRLVDIVDKIGYNPDIAK